MWRTTSESWKGKHVTESIKTKNHRPLEEDKASNPSGGI